MCGLSVTAAVGLPVDGFSRLPIAFGSAKAALEQRFYVGRGQIFFYGDLQESGGSTAYMPLETLDNDIIQAALYESQERFERAIKQLHDCICEYHIGQDDLRINCIMMICRTIMLLNQPYISSMVTRVCQKLLRLNTAEEMLQEVRDFLQSARNFLMHNTQQYHARIAKEVMDIVEKDLTEDLSLEAIANLVHISKGYMAKIFKDVTGENVNRYIIRTRMKEAKRLLTDRELQIAEVARMVGYSSAAYFSAAFKEEYSISPKSYRDQLGFETRENQE